MAPRQPETKEQALHYLLEDIVEGYLVNQRGIASVSSFVLKGFLKRAEENKEGGLDAYYLAKAMINVLQGRLNAAEAEFKKAIRISPNDPIILTNYSVALRLLNKNAESSELLIKVIKSFGFVDKTMLNNILFNSIPNLEPTYLQEAAEYLQTDEMNDDIDNLILLKKDLQRIDVSLLEFQEIMGLLRPMVNKRTRQQFIPRFSIENGLDKYLKIEIFLNVNTEEASELNSEFFDILMDYVFENDRHNLLGKFSVVLKQLESRYDGTENPEALYLGVNEELVA
ncbi:tetratricopeptide repeat protein [Psychrobacter sp. 230]|uniref:tetratricopeptide repeat protein n=1 Tax=Psychrobacter sp. 230 TaxID=2555884 RepID=UPI0010686609|nr:hypothetical protein [Psychrobacter sp. 230]TEW87141.1 hypothetical protein E2545_06090 [Psychrobacter sp. 230]|tara:strand:- start:13411 stop:14259 length:849 start_codon:yes stop_codon:yes gene_type:complete